MQLLKAQCCRIWPVLAGVPIGKCGYCKEVPRLVGVWNDEVDLPTHKVYYESESDDV